MTDYIPLFVLNDFVFCQYSIYLHQVYMEADEDVYKAAICKWPGPSCGTR